MQKKVFYTFLYLSISYIDIMHIHWHKINFFSYDVISMYNTHSCWIGKRSVENELIY